MATLTPQERLQPALLDRLLDDEPEATKEAADRRVMNKAQLRQAVLRDLAWLFNTTRLGTSESLAGMSEAQRSVVNFGLPALSGQTASTLDVIGLERSVKQAIIDFEPRILPGTLEVRALSTEEQLDRHNMISVEIRGTLWGQPVPIAILLRTEVDLESGEVAIEDLGS